MDITAAMVKELRQRTGAGMMECKKALTAAGGDMEVAIEQMRVSGLAKADKKSDNTAAEGVVSIRLADDGSRYAMVEINSQTDFASKSEDFTGFVDAVSDVVLAELPADTAALGTLKLAGGDDIETTRKNLIAKIGENIQVRRFVAANSAGGTLGQYSHGGRIGVICEVQGGDAALAKDIAMHVAASKPVCINPEDISSELLAKEKAVFEGEAAESGKPPEIVEKMVEGKIRKYLAEVTLVGQPFVKDPDQTVGQLLKAAGATVTSFQRLEVGEGIEKKEENFAEEVMAQVRGS
ncbi:MAG: translation elongation factor Ts [Gammaproteobacteria bacterium]|nr:translation elongation factor Ts [Gammaproteobacteria bacterium]